MYRIRPIQRNDIDSILALAKAAGNGMTTLPVNRALLESKIDSSIAAFTSTPNAPGEEAYLMVLEAMTTGQVVGTTGIYAGVGLGKSFYSYKILTLTQYSHELNLHVTNRVLTLVNDYAGATEVGSLFLHPDHRHSGNGQLLARCRYLLMANEPHRFSDLVLAEMRGVQNAAGSSPFWEALGKHFFGIPFHEADYLSGVGNNQFIADLMPKYPIYVDLLPAEAQAAIGQPYEATRPAMRLLEKEGFRFNNTIDIFDAGPCLDTHLNDIRTVRESRLVTIDTLLDDVSLPHHLVSSCDAATFHAFYLPLQPMNDPTHVAIYAKAAQQYNLAVGDRLRLAP